MENLLTYQKTKETREEGDSLILAIYGPFSNVFLRLFILVVSLVQLGLRGESHGRRSLDYSMILHDDKS